VPFATIANRRLHFQSLARARFARAEDVVEWLGAVQSQDYAGAKWALGLRTTGSSDADIEQAFNTGAILRTHVLRPTWHFVVPRDIRWMLELTAPRVRGAMAFQGRWLGLEAPVFTRCNRLLVRELAGQPRTRSELSKILGHTSVSLGHVLMRAELDGVICSGPLQGKQHTYALLDERVAEHRSLDRDQALALLARRFFRSHGPATVRDFAWWSGLTMADAKVGAASAGEGVVSEMIGGQAYWMLASAASQPRAGRTYLLPNFDEYLVAYADRSAAYDGADPATPLRNTVVVDGQVVGNWRRTIAAGTVAVEVSLFKRLRHTERLARAVEQYGAFLGRAAKFRV
jgi:winged helix DNA-binding protein